MKDGFDGRQSCMERTPRWKTNFNGGQSWMEQDHIKRNHKTRVKHETRGDVNWSQSKLPSIQVLR